MKLHLFFFLPTPPAEGAQTGRSVVLRTRRVPLRNAAQPPSQTTNINMGAEQSLPARSSPLRPRFEVTTGEEARRKDGLREGFPNAGAGTSRRPQGGLSSRAGACPEGGGVDTAAGRIPPVERAYGLSV